MLLCSLWHYYITSSSYCLTGQCGLGRTDVLTVLSPHGWKAHHYHDQGQESKSHGHHRSFRWALLCLVWFFWTWILQSKLLQNNPSTFNILTLFISFLSRHTPTFTPHKSSINPRWLFSTAHCKATAMTDRLHSINTVPQNSPHTLQDNLIEHRANSNSVHILLQYLLLSCQHRWTSEPSQHSSFLKPCCFLYNYSIFKKIWRKWKIKAYPNNATIINDVIN